MVPMAQAFILRKCLPLKLKLFSVSIWCMRVVITFVDASLCALLSRHSSRANNPS